MTLPGVLPKDMEEDLMVVIKDETELYLYLAIGLGVLSGLLLVTVIILAVMLKYDNTTT